MCICWYMTLTINIQKYGYFSAIRLLFNHGMRYNKNDLEKISKTLYLFKLTSNALLSDIKKTYNQVPTIILYI